MTDGDFSDVCEKLASAKQDALNAPVIRLLESEDLTGIAELSRLSATMAEHDVSTFTATGAPTHALEITR